MAKKGNIRISQIHLGGLAFSKYEGRKNSVASSVGIDIHGQPGVFKANQTMTRESDTLLTERVDVMISGTDGRVYAFSYDSGKVYQRESNGTWALAYTTVPTSGEARCLGAAIFEGYIYWATESYLHRIALSDVGDWALNAEANWQVFTNTDDTYHPMLVLDNRLWIGDGNYVDQVYQGTFTDQALDILTYHRVSALGKYDTDLLIGTAVDDNFNKSTLYRWNRWSVSWTVEDDIEEVGINAIIPMDNYSMIQAGRKGNIYSYNGAQLNIYTEIPADMGPTDVVLVHPNATDNYKGMPIFGVSNVSGTSAIAGVYSLHTKNAQTYPRVMNVENTISTDNIDGVDITSLLVHGDNIFIAWTRSGVSGIDKIDTTTKHDGAYVESRVAYLDRNTQTVMSRIVINYVDLPTDTGIEVYIKENYADSWTQLTTVNDVIRKQIVCRTRKNANVYQWKFVLRTNANDTPIVDEINIEFE